MKFAQPINGEGHIYQSMLKDKLSNEDYMRLRLKYDNKKNGRLH